MWTIIRFRAGSDDGPAALLAPVVTHFAASKGCLRAELVQNIDDDGLWAIVTEWACVGDYRRSLSGEAAKLLLTPVLALAIDEPSAYLPFA